MSETKISERDSEVLKAIPVVVSSILPRYCFDFSSMSESLEEGKGNCLAYMKWGGAVLETLGFSQPWYCALSCYISDESTAEVEHGCLVMPDIPAYFDSEDGLVLDCISSGGDLGRLARSRGENPVYSEQYLSFHNPLAYPTYRYNNFYPGSEIQYPEFAANKILEIVANNPGLAPLLPDA